MLLSFITKLENNIINWESTEEPFSVLKIDINSNDGTKYLSQYIDIIDYYWVRLHSPTIVYWIL